MPDFGVSEIIGLIGALASGVGVGTSLYSAANQPGAPKPVTPSPAQVTADATKTRTAQEASLSQQFPGIQAATGGSLAPEAWVRLAELISGQAGTPGIGSAGQDLLSKLQVSSGATNSTVNTGPGLTASGYGA